MYYCEVCKRPLKKKLKVAGLVVCKKHKRQFEKYGKFLDKIQRNIFDLNDFTVDKKNQTATFSLYNQRCQKIGSFIIDLEDLPVVRYKKWRISHGQPMTGLPAKKTDRSVAHVILNHDVKNSSLVVDHIDGNTFNNRKKNLRLVTQCNNTKNQCLNKKNTSGFKGIYFDKRKGNWAGEIRFNEKRFHFTRKKDKREVVYQRFIAEKLLYKEFARKSELQRMEDFTASLPQSVKNKLYNNTKEKIFGN